VSEKAKMNEELREWLGLKPADLLVYVAIGAIIAMYFLPAPINLIFGIAAVLLALAACPIGMKSSPALSRFTSGAKKVAYPAFVVLALVLLFFRNVTYYQIPQNGMYPGMPAGTRFLALRRPYISADQVAKGDIVIFKRNEGGVTYNFIWRVIGLPKESIRTKGDKIFLNGIEIARNKVRTAGEVEIFQEKNGDAVYEVALPMKPGTKLPPDVDLTIPDGHFFVLGDNRHNALDSRYFGPIPFEAIIAKKW
jgi:signal peptidase I